MCTAPEADDGRPVGRILALRGADARSARAATGWHQTKVWRTLAPHEHPQR
jgi:hypothetical protein